MKVQWSQNVFEEKEDDLVPMSTVINNVKKMAHDPKARQIASSQSLAINTVSYEDCARNKFSVWGPCISDMTLQVDNQRMPVMREPNYTDKTWDVETDKIPLVVGNHDPNPGAQLKTISLREYLENFNDYMSTPPKNGKKINLIANDMFAKQDDKYVIMSSQCCCLPIEKGKETKFNVALFNYQSKKQDPAVLVIVSTSKGTSAQIIEGNEQKLLFNNYGQKADFIGQRLTDNRIERNVPIHGPMTKQEKQDNCIVIIQIPLKQKPTQIHTYSTQYDFNYVPTYQPYSGLNMYGGGGMGGGGGFNVYGGQSAYMQQQQIQQQQQQQQQNQAFGFMAEPDASQDLLGDFFGGNNSNNHVQHNHNSNNNFYDQTFAAAQPQSTNYDLYNTVINSSNNNNYNQGTDDFCDSFGAAQPQSASMNQMNGFSSMSNNINMNAMNAEPPKPQKQDFHAMYKVKMNKKHKKKRAKKKPDANVEAAIVKIAPKTAPTCGCGGLLKEVELRDCYMNSEGGGVNCDGCSKPITGPYTKVWHCPLEKSSWQHKDGYDLCTKCGEKQLKFDELNGMQTVERDTRYPIRVTLQYYKSTDNGVLDMDIMKAIKNLLEKSQKQADYIGSLVTDYSIRSTEADLISKNEVKVIHHVNKVKVNVPVPVNPMQPIYPTPLIVQQPQDPFAGLVGDMKDKVNFGKYSKVADALKSASEKNWKQYLENFKNEEVTDEDLENLSRDDLMALIPKMGPRNRFLKWLQSEYPKDNAETNFMSGFL